MQIYNKNENERKKCVGFYVDSSNLKIFILSFIKGVNDEDSSPDLYRSGEEDTASMQWSDFQHATCGKGQFYTVYFTIERH